VTDPSSGGGPQRPAAILDIDGTLVDTNYHHAIAWYRAFRRLGLTLPLFRIHRHIGMGSDQLVGSLAGEEWEAEHGDAVREAESELYMQLIDQVQPLACARELMETLRDRGHALVLASSAKPHEVDHYLDLLDARPLADGWTTSGDVERTKPEPDLVAAAVEKAGGGPAVMLGDSTWDCEAAERAGVPTVGLLTGGFSEQELREAGAACVFRELRELLDELEASPFGDAPVRHQTPSSAA
jgi:HAD superfamily hydrolase (TIGR01509 family)